MSKLKRFSPSVEQSQLNPEAGDLQLVMIPDSQGYYVTYDEALSFADQVRDEAVKVVESKLEAIKRNVLHRPDINTVDQQDVQSEQGDNETMTMLNPNQLTMNDMQPVTPQEYKPVQDTLKERGATYGEFSDNASLSQCMKDLMKSQAGWGVLSLTQRESLEVIAQKIARILNGNPNYLDNWHDIAGYATLAEEDIKKRKGV